MRVLLPIIYHDLTQCIARAFEEEGHEVRVVDWRSNAKEHRRHKITPMIIQAAEEFRPDLAFCQFQAPGLITSKMPDTLRSMGCFTVNWAGDVRHPLPQWYIDLAPHFNVTSFSNMPDVEEVRTLGYRSEFLQIGYDERLYHRQDTGERRGVVFIGNNYGGYKYAESQSRRDLVAALAKAYPNEFTVYGMSWESVCPDQNIGGYLREPDDAVPLRSALVAVNWDHFHRPWFASDRLLRGTACGCAMVSQHYEGINVEHPKVVGVHGIEEAVQAVGMLLRRPDVAEQLGAMCADNTLAKHRWNNRVKIIEQWMQQ